MSKISLVVFILIFSNQAMAGLFNAGNTAPVSSGTAPLFNASQSSTFTVAIAQRALDGNTSGLWPNASIATTKREAQPWWQADLGAIAPISSVTVFNRTDCCSNRLSDFYILISNTPFGAVPLASLLSNPAVQSFHFPGAAGASESLPTNTSGRYVRIQLNGTNYLSIAEVEVTSSASALATTEARARASQFLARTTFGPTKTELNTLSNRILQIGHVAAFNEWIDIQFALPTSHHHPLAKQMITDDGWGFVDSGLGVKSRNYRDYAWWHQALTAPDQLRQRVAWALSQIFVVGYTGPRFNNLMYDTSGEPQYLGIVDYYDMLLDNSFGNYRNLIQDVTYHPIMGAYLSHVRNSKGDASINRFPDENYAREILQLFSIGLYKLNSSGEALTNSQGDFISTYTNQDITEYARVFTGLGYAGAPSFQSGIQDLHTPMVMHNSFHDTGAKTLIDGTVLPAGQNGNQDISDALDNLADHPNVGPFIVRQLIQRLVKSNPAKSYINAVVAKYNNNGAGVRGDFKAVLKAILLHPQALNTMSYTSTTNPDTLRIRGRGTESSKLREPVLRYSALFRAFNASSTHPQSRFMIPSFYNYFNQEVYRSPSVFNFYLPNHIPSGSIKNYSASQHIPNGSVYAPEFQIHTAVAVNRINNRFRLDINDAKLDTRSHTASGVVDYDIVLDLSAEYQAAASNPALMMSDLNILLCQGAFSQTANDNLLNIVTTQTSNPVLRARTAVLGMVTSPDCAVGD